VIVPLSARDGVIDISIIKAAIEATSFLLKWSMGTSM
jgi:hypothetical protein